LYPSISARGSLGNSGDAWFPNNHSWSAGLSVSYPFFSGGREWYDAALGTVAKSIASQTFRQTVQQLRATVQANSNVFLDAIEQVAVTEKFAQASQAQASITSAKYINGLVSYYEWYSTQNDNISAQKSILNVRRDVLLQQAAWNNVRGDLQ
jgi:outer membrane protein